MGTSIGRNISLFVGICGFLVAILFTACDPFPSEEYEVAIPQDIGGELLCDVSYGCDQHTCHTGINYKYLNKDGESISVGWGRFNDENWDREVQIQRLRNNLVLKTQDLDFAKIYVGDIQGNRWKEYSLGPGISDHADLWKATGIDDPSKIDPEFMTVSEIRSTGEIDLIFEFNTGGIIENTEKRIIVYQLDPSGVPKLSEIKDK